MPRDTCGGAESSGTVSGFGPEQPQAVRILDQQSTVHLTEDGTIVKVHDILRNMTDRRFKARFDFPIEKSVDPTPISGRAAVDFAPGLTWRFIDHVPLENGALFRP